MNFSKKIILTISSFFCVGLSAQNFDDLVSKFGAKNAVNNIIRCGSHEYNLFLQQNNPAVTDIFEFENWMRNKSNDFIKADKNELEIITLPVVVHVIHGGGAVGKNGNITDAQIKSQLEILNQDYRRLEGTRGWNNSSVGADVGIEFCLARQTPEGQISDGINRVEYNGIKSVTFERMQNEIKPQTQWDPNRYLNIWVVPDMRSGSNMLLGYAQFPQQSGLPGLMGMELANTDGVVIWYKSFGSSDYDDGTFDLASGFDLGRTTTHEIGHYLGLRHIWADSNICTEDDFCEDTPQANSPSSGCDQRESCGGVNMIENYMDYSGDFCMNIFTQDQKTRMLTVLKNSPRRKELLNSNVCQTPESHGLDVHVKGLTTSNGDCEENVEAVLEIQNRGEETLKNLTIKYDIPNSNFSKTYEWTGNLISWENTKINLPSIKGLINGTQNLFVTIVKVNGKDSDDNIDNNTATVFFDYSAQPFNTKKIVLKLKTDNFGKETSWKFINKVTKEVLYKSEGTYANNTEYEFTFDVEDETCYEFYLIDTGKDGICCAYGDGYFKLLSDAGEEITSGGKFTKTDTEKKSIRISSILGTDISLDKSLLKFYPNPVMNVLNIHNSTIIQAVIISDLTGKQVFSKTINAKQIQINLAHLSTGVYIVNVVVKGKVKIFKIIKK
ncbi:T9SS type A sorting domain-containing protein [Empedobacter brevis]|uniref:M43 family zinc metalloprotease n=1 Tax=Empedobacter brevis TaxID=247 RepID=UPI00123D10E8|nr:M43 family zinc metalloprotease [Empedobacter brevis]QES93957.1 T9SS type A sorting domain-containing protein [Empedobacter brevis]